jgi:ABC-2 type transport system ATP-binding protein
MTGVEAAIRTHALTKVYGGRTVVDHVDLLVPRGSISGFVGPNGAGKTTTLRMLLGLVRPTHGDGEVLGASVAHPPDYLARVGSLIEGPAFYPTLSARSNLRVLASLGGFSKARVDEVLEIVELTDRAGDLFRTYSLGMKQRLGVAAALLPAPELLVLDEPTNGLDPGGIIETRALLRRFREQGMTVFVSSHLLGELEQVADWLVLIDHGRLAYQGPIGDLVGSRHATLLVAGETRADLEVIAAVARRLGSDASVVDGHVRIEDATLAAEVNRAAMKAGVTLTELTVQRPSLEESFLAVTGGHLS